ncbi:hypothetical protein KL86DYS2_20088 [uncultured Dysgonomonas sp.]|uniref:Uncharacterized protein n=1 Tax=uncultured Dysgonomonas sp. TaxID=206096 RepID=A0A212KFZ0_9BACT|nr:hypothetical protein KL86DYS2_20088 [uncultured Dysgonomonas sp.]
MMICLKLNLLASMSGRIKKLELSLGTLQNLDMLYSNGETHCFRMRCMVVLL